ncbi:MAG: hypothetical protein QOE61_4337 [Micromonosporaceae bacterium]|jgi:alkanesulfonate monooxygenase SsuD/methylene tetrahydromethanopterin reductase-like flavin-dependent oxidoreductase (luciferase family)|nr:hypothetical protein [Micromonosporaceae bacterium]
MTAGPSSGTAHSTSWTPRSGVGSVRFADELRATGEELDDRRREQMLDESLEILTAAWSGRPVHHHSRHYTVGAISFLPRPVQRSGVQVWAAGPPVMSTSAFMTDKHVEIAIERMR